MKNAVIGALLLFTFVSCTGLDGEFYGNFQSYTGDKISLRHKDGRELTLIDNANVALKFRNGVKNMSDSTVKITTGKKREQSLSLLWPAKEIQFEVEPKSRLYPKKETGLNYDLNVVWFFGQVALVDEKPVVLMDSAACSAITIRNGVCFATKYSHTDYVYEARRMMVVEVLNDNNEVLGQMNLVSTDVKEFQTDTMIKE